MIDKVAPALMFLAGLTLLALVLSSREVHRHQRQEALAHQTPACVVIVHLGDGKELPGLPMQQVAQITDNVEQIRLFNPMIPVFVAYKWCRLRFCSMLASDG